MAEESGYRRLIWVIVAIGAVVALVLPARALSSARGSTDLPDATGPLFVGVTHTQDTIEPWDPEPAQELADDILRRAAPVQNQFLMGWGALNPEPSPGQYDWQSLDQRLARITATGGTPVVTLCCAPDWMKGGAAGHTDWDRLGVAPDPAHYDDFAALAVAVSQRYPQVRHFAVWSELRGFYNPWSNDWDMPQFVAFYDTVYRALKQHDPTLQVGGPGPVMDSWAYAEAMSDPSDVRGPWGVVDQRALDALSYWLEHAAGADFLTLNASTANRYTGRTIPVSEAVGKLRAIGDWIRARTDLPQWWMEVYSPAQDREATSYSHWIPATPESIDLALDTIRAAGGHVALLWNPQGTRTLCTNCLWTWPGSPGGSRETEFVPVLASHAALTEGLTP